MAIEEVVIFLKPLESLACKFDQFQHRTVSCCFLLNFLPCYCCYWLKISFCRCYYTSSSWLDSQSIIMISMAAAPIFIPVYVSSLSSSTCSDFWLGLLEAASGPGMEQPGTHLVLNCQGIILSMIETSLLLSISSIKWFTYHKSD